MCSRHARRLVVDLRLQNLMSGRHPDTSDGDRHRLHALHRYRPLSFTDLDPAGMRGGNPPSQFRLRDGMTDPDHHHDGKRNDEAIRVLQL